MIIVPHEDVYATDEDLQVVAVWKPFVYLPPDLVSSPYATNREHSTEATEHELAQNSERDLTLKTHHQTIGLISTLIL